MASINEGVDFIYGNISSEIYGLKIATGFGSTTRSANVETREIITSSNPSSKTFSFHGVKYTSPNTFDLIIYKEDGTYINEENERQLKKWLLSSNFKWLSIDQTSLNGISYYCIVTQCTILDVGAYSGGMLISFQMDSSGAWSKLDKLTRTTSNGTLNFRMFLDTDYDDEIVRPQLTITASSSGNISIKNVTRNETITITGCVSGEVIILDGTTGKVSTTASGVLLDRWNKKYLKLQDGQNDILLTGNFSLNIQYRKQVRVGG